jgi:hypothetical protein
VAQQLFTVRSYQMPFKWVGNREVHLKSPNNKAAKAPAAESSNEIRRCVMYVCTSWRRNEIIIALSEAIISNFFLGGTLGAAVCCECEHTHCTLSLVSARALARRRSITASLLRARWDDALAHCAGRCISEDCRYSSYSVGNYCWCSALRYLISFLSKQQQKRGGRWLALLAVDDVTSRTVTIEGFSTSQIVFFCILSILCHRKILQHCGMSLSSEFWI